MGVQKIFESLDFRFKVDVGLLRVKMGGDHEVEMNWRWLLKRPDIGKPQHRIAAMGKDDPFQEIELLLEEAFKGGFDQMAAIRRKMGLSMRYLDRGSHQAKGMATCSIDQLFRNIGAEKADGLPSLRKVGTDFSIPHGGNCFDLF